MAAQRVVLTSPELLALIFSHFTPRNYFVLRDGGTPEEWAEYSPYVGALNSAARTCKAFLRPALAVLWRRIDNISGLLRLLPGWKDVGGLGYEEALVIEGNITEEIWARFRWYTQFVKELNQDDWDWIHPYTWTLLMQWCGREPLLPNLERFVSLPLSVRNPTMGVFLSPTLRHLSLVLTDGPEREDVRVGSMLVRKLASTVPMLQIFELDNQMKAGPFHRHDLPCLTGFRDLRRVTVKNLVLTKADVYALAYMPRLTSLSLTVDITGSSMPLRDEADENVEEDYSDDEAETPEEGEGESGSNDDPMDEDNVLDHAARDAPAFSLTPGGFRALRHLSLTGRMQHLECVLRCRPPILESLTLDSLMPVPFREFQRCVMSVCASVPATLSALSIKHERKFDEWEDLSLMDLIRPVFGLRHLSSLSLEFYDLPAFGDDDVKTFSEVWPELTSLHIPRGVHRRNPGLQRPTSAALSLCALYLPCLTELVLPELDFGPPPYTVPVMHHGLQRLFFDFRPRDSDSVRPFDVAAVVDMLFPRLDLERDRPSPWLPEDERRYYKKSAWWKVRTYLAAMQAGRGQGSALKQAREQAHADRVLGRM